MDINFRLDADASARSYLKLHERFGIVARRLLTRGSTCCIGYSFIIFFNLIRVEKK